MPVDNGDFDPRLDAVLRDGRDDLGDVAWFDAHTHIGQNDPDERKATEAEILGGLDRAGHQRALVFPMHEPGGYAAANDVVLAAAGSAHGRLEALARVSPHAPDALAEAERCLALGARGVKLHPRSDAFGLPHPVVEQIVALAHEQRRIVLFHAGRGIPNLGEAVVDMARRYPNARLVLAHAGVSDLGWIGAYVDELPNLFFDTAWWHVSDQLQLFATVAPGHILYASDMPYSPGALTAFVFLRAARAVGVSAEAQREVAGGQLARLVAGEDPADLGPAPGFGRLGERTVESERVVLYAMSAVHLAYRGVDPSETLALARLACQTSRRDAVGELLHALDHLLQIAQEALAADPTKLRSVGPAAVAAAATAGTPRVPVPDAGR